MGLASYKEYKKQKAILEFLAKYGITEDDLKKLHQSLEVKKEEPVTLTEKQKEEIKKAQENKITPEDLIKQFSEEVEEFRINGK